ncbi:MAG: hydrogenase nickel incorporation protein HypB [Bryobacterales bacterium]|jgi:hydrogenase nickel incorporation protein HypB|nr:hydrogenase nickel incorporation protein HypB [Bryobacterales bacterium]
MSTSNVERVANATPVLVRNQELAAANYLAFEADRVLAVNLMSAPGAGKTSVLEATLRALGGKRRAGVIEGDLETTRDADRILALGIPAHQINTGTVCHLDARMVSRALEQFPVGGFDVLFIENVGNLVCPAEFDLGERLRVMVFSVTEGADKPKKYPLMFHRSHAVLLNKIDLLPYCGVSLEELTRNVREVNPDAAIFPVSCRTGEGIAEWVSWLDAQIPGE